MAAGRESHFSLGVQPLGDQPSCSGSLPYGQHKLNSVGSVLRDMEFEGSMGYTWEDLGKEQEINMIKMHCIRV